MAKGDLSWWRAVRESKDPASFVVLFEDSAALAGLLVAGLGIWASHAWGDARIDGVASIIIGAILAAVAVLLAREAKDLLIGERADPLVVDQVRRVVAARAGVITVNHVRTIHTAPEVVFVALSVDFDDKLTMGEGEALIESIEHELKACMPQLSSIYIRPEKHEQSFRIGHEADEPAKRGDQ